MPKGNLGKVKIETMLFSGNPLEWFLGDLEFGREFLAVALCSLFPPSPSYSGESWVGKYSIEYVRVMVPFVVAPRRVVMDTSFHHDHFPALSTLKHQLPNSVIELHVFIA